MSQNTVGDVIAVSECFPIQVIDRRPALCTGHKGEDHSKRLQHKWQIGPTKMQSLTGVLKFLLEKSLARDHSQYVIGVMEIKLLALLCFRQGSSIGTDTVAKMTQGSCMQRTFVRGMGAWHALRTA